MRVIVNNWLLVLRQLTDYELEAAVKSHQMEMARLDGELESLIGEQVRRRMSDSIHNTPALF